MKRATISQVAKTAGVSQTTVSRYLNGKYSKMSDKTKAKIAQTIKELNYVPTASARQLRQSNSYVVGLLVGDVSNTFSCLLAKGIDDVLKPAGYDIVMMNTNNMLDVEQRSLQRLFELRADGIIVQPDSINYDSFAECRRRDVPLVLVDREVKDQPDDIGKVTSANQDACYQLGRVFKQRGYQNILAVSAHFAQASGQIPRIAGLKMAAEDFGLLYYDLETQGHSSEWLHRELLKAIRGLRGRTAVISLMGPVLFSILDIFHSAGIRFPEDVGLVSFDDWDWSKYVQGGIFLLKQDVELMGRLAAKKLLHQIQGKTTQSDLTVLPVEFIDKPSL